MNTIKRLSVAFLFATAALGTSALALAKPAANKDCGAQHGVRGRGQGEHARGDRGREHGEARFKQADKNRDGFLTRSEVGDHRWDHLRAADANRDGKISRSELQQRHQAGKPEHRGQKPAK